MKRAFYRLFYLLLGILPILSCTPNQKYHQFHPLELSPEGIGLVGEDRFHLSAEIPNEGKEFHITGIGEYADKMCVSDVTVDGALQNDPARPITSLDGDWGSFEQKGNTICFVIAPYDGNTRRIMEFTIGYGYWIRYLRLEQTSESSAD